MAGTDIKSRPLRSDFDEVLLELLEVTTLTMAMWVCKGLCSQLVLDLVDAILNGVVPLVGHALDGSLQSCNLGSCGLCFFVCGHVWKVVGRAV